MPIYIVCKNCKARFEVPARWRAYLPPVFRFKCPICGYEGVYTHADLVEELRPEEQKPAEAGPMTGALTFIAIMNMYAFTELQRYVAQRLGIEVGYYMHVADSYHVYESDWKRFTTLVEQIRTGESKKYWVSSEGGSR